MSWFMTGYSMRPTTIATFGVLVGSLLLFGSWDAESFVAFLVFGMLIATYLSHYYFPNSVLDS